ncbi:response regulator transcription factor [Dechloromonas sp. HYN0024]|uniref:helix-turn-helix transcriptional regulator n=1 Tax=Dechloromonas sp. HYN0024 TaxID=2231055 RepID=UPI000E42D631|nr:response regulator transcription factor [Dechloromonas sp. HYN0024]AXS79269.1 DNA-binding response regulator [Dechloromonas sp. HYN0024]
MKHWIIDRDGVLLPSWCEAFPQACVLQPDELAKRPPGDLAVLWCRCRAGETADSVLRQVELNPGEFAVVLADEPDETVVAESLALGASGCCNTHAAPEVLRQVALVVENGGLWVGQTLLRRLVGSASRVLASRADSHKEGEWLSLLSDREAQVARHVAGGASNREIANQLSITERTVKAHLSAIFEKLGLRDRLQLSLRINGLNM